MKKVKKRALSDSNIKTQQYDFSVLRGLRQQAGATLERTAEETGVSLSTLTRIESNQNMPSLPTLATLAEYFGMSPPNLLELAGSHVVEHGEEQLEVLGDVRRRGVSLPDVQIILGEADAEDFSQRPHTHKGFYQVQWVLEGRLRAQVQGREYELSAGQAIKFDAGFEHVSRFEEATKYIVVLVPKRTK